MTDSPAEARDYRGTVFLPKTPFPMRGDLPKREPAMLERWARLKIWERGTGVTLASGSCSCAGQFRHRVASAGACQPPQTTTTGPLFCRIAHASQRAI